MSADNPWLTIPLADYEAHMALPQVGQAQLLADLFAAELHARSPSSVAVLGCAGGNGFERAPSTLRVVGVDVAPIDPPIDNANTIALQGDLTEPTVIAAVLEALGGPADVLLCDAAPKLTGLRDTDRANEERLLLAVELALPRLLRPGGDALVKLLEGPEAQAIDKRLRARFASAKSVKPSASRPGSSERYLLARGYRGAAG